MNNQICNTLDVYLVAELGTNKGMTPEDLSGEKHHTFLTDDFEIEPEVQTSEAGTLYIVDVTISSEKIPTADVIPFRSPRSCIVQVSSLMDHQKILLGSRRYPAKVQITPVLNGCRVHLYAAMLESPFIR